MHRYAGAPPGRRRPLLGSTTSDRNGVFSLTVPAQQTVSAVIDKPGGETLAVPTGRTNLSVGACLRDVHG